jgi:hypothetical protein
MSVEQVARPRSRGRPARDPDPRLPIKWAVILALSTGCGLLIGSAEGIGAGLLASLGTLGLLYRVVRDQ